MAIDKSGNLANEIIEIFSKQKQNENTKYFQRTIPIKKMKGKIILNLKNNKAYNLNNEKEKIDYYSNCDGLILCLNRNNLKSKDEISK